MVEPRDRAEDKGGPEVHPETTAVLAGKGFQRFPEHGCRLWILASILENRDQAAVRVVTSHVLPVALDGLVNLQEVKFIRQLKSLDTRCQLGNGFILLERMQGIRTTLILLTIFVGDGQAEKSRTELSLGNRLHTKLVVTERRKGPLNLSSQLGRLLCRLVQRPSPTFPIGLGIFPAPDRLMEYRLAFLVHRGSLVVTVTGVAISKIRQLTKVCQVLQSPGFRVTTTVKQRIGELQEELSHFSLVVILFSQGPSLHHQLQGTYMIPLQRVDHLATTTTPSPSLKIPCDLVTKMTCLQVVLSCRR